MGGTDIRAHLAAVPDRVDAPVVLHQAVELGPRTKRAGKPGARQRPDDDGPVGLVAGKAAGIEGRGRRERDERRQMAPDRRHHADARIRVSEAGMDVHAAHQEAAHRLLHRDLEVAVTRLRRHPLLPPGCERVRRGRHRPRAVGLRRLDDQAARLGKRLAQVRYRGADPRVGLHLGAQQLRHHRMRTAFPFATLHDPRVGVGDEVARFRIDQEELFLNAERERQSRLRHRPFSRWRRSFQSPITTAAAVSFEA